jgi:Domain of unknown function (DUF4405)
MGAKNKRNAWLNAGILAGFVLTVVTGVILWIFLPDGRRSGYAVFLGFAKRDWTTVHDWAGLAMMALITLHLALHWKWIACAAARFLGRTSRSARIHLVVDTAAGAAFLIAGLSGLILRPALGGGGYQGGRNPFYNAAILGLARNMWKDVHFWAGLAMVSLVALHLALHWRWIVCAIRNFARREHFPVRSGSAAAECGLQAGFLRK